VHTVTRPLVIKQHVSCWTFARVGAIGIYARGVGRTLDCCLIQTLVDVCSTVNGVNTS